MKTFVYFNLHKKVWSLRSKGLVWGHSTLVEIIGARFKVSEAGRQRTIREKKKFVHAGVEGAVGAPIGNVKSLKAKYEARHGEGVSVSYNPFKGSAFFDRETGKSVDSAAVVLMLPGREVVAYGVQYRA